MADGDHIQSSTHERRILDLEIKVIGLESAINSNAKHLIEQEEKYEKELKERDKKILEITSMLCLAVNKGSINGITPDVSEKFVTYFSSLSKEYSYWQRMGHMFTFVSGAMAYGAVNAISAHLAKLFGWGPPH